MKIKLRRPSPAMLVALLALFLAVGGNVVAYGLGRNSVHSRDIAHGAVRASDLGKFRVRTSGPILDLDTTAHDGIYAGAGGRAKCKPGERLITGGSQQRSGGPSVTPYIRLVEEEPVPAEQAWAVKWASDLGGAASEQFEVVALCLAR
jgi:hypothetical protein